MHFYGWEKGLKTGMYYLRSRPATNAIKFTVDVEALIKESCEGFELKHFNNSVASSNPDAKGIPTLVTSMPAQQASSTTSKIIPECEPEKQEVKACPLRKKKKTVIINEKGEKIESEVNDDEDCLACGS